jgi:hypothetical protein
VIKTDGVIIEMFLYISNWETDKEHDICLRGLNGTFGMDEMQEFFKQFKDEPPTSMLLEAISKEFGKENETMYSVYANLDYDSGEYGDYGVMIYAPYYWIGKILNVEKHDIVDPFLDERLEETA